MSELRGRSIPPSPEGAILAVKQARLDYLEGELLALATAGLLREPRARPVGLLDLCSNDYLGYASQALDPGDAAGGASGSRLVAGDDGAHEAAEAALAGWLRAESALLFSSGYAANVGTIAALARPGDTVVSDALNHASLIDGCRLSGASIRVAAHGDVDAFETALRAAPSRGRRWVVTESYFSMDGDCADLRGLREVCDRHDAAMVVDEAHALGVFGQEGRGLCAEAGVAPDVLVGMAGKALGLQGAFVVGPSNLRQWLWNRARSFVFSTGVSPGLARCLAARVGQVRADDGGRAELHDNAALLRAALRARGVAGDERACGPIIPWLVGDPAEAQGLSARLATHGLYVQAIRPPTVPVGGARLRMTARARLTPEQLGLARRAIALA
jgi:8-amino-7-oxononanoate synthase